MGITTKIHLWSEKKENNWILQKKQTFATVFYSNHNWMFPLYKFGKWKQILKYSQPFSRVIAKKFFFWIPKHIFILKLFISSFLRLKRKKNIHCVILWFTSKLCWFRIAQKKKKFVDSITVHLTDCALQKLVVFGIWATTINGINEAIVLDGRKKKIWRIKKQLKVTLVTIFVEIFRTMFSKWFWIISNESKLKNKQVRSLASNFLKVSCWNKFQANVFFRQ